MTPGRSQVALARPRPADTRTTDRTGGPGRWAHRTTGIAPAGCRNRRRTGRHPPGTRHIADTSPQGIYTSARPARPRHKPQTPNRQPNLHLRRIGRFGSGTAAQRQPGNSRAREVASRRGWRRQVSPVARTRSSGTASRGPARRGPRGRAPGQAPHSPRVPRNGRPHAVRPPQDGPGPGRAAGRYKRSR